MAAAKKPPPGRKKTARDTAGGLAGRLEKLGIRNDFDLLLHLPLRYVDETRIWPIADLLPGMTALVEGEVRRADIQYRPRRQLICTLEDASGSLQLRFFHFYPNHVRLLTPGRRVRALGEIRAGFLDSEMIHPQCRGVTGDAPLPDALTPVYPTTAGLSQDSLRRLIGRALEKADLADTLSDAERRRLELWNFADALATLHHPPPDVARQALQERRHPAWRRLKFDELLAQQISMRLHYRRRHALAAPPLTPRGDLCQRFRAGLPFPLTAAQDRVIAEIDADLARPHPMQRLLQGDVGSGKTVVAALAALRAIGNGRQAALMAPTEILAEQHYRKLAAWLAPLGVRVAWLAAALPKKDRQAALAEVADGSAQLAVGTHALFQDQVGFHDLALAIVDEQHRFGVHQRLALRRKGGQPHQLMMSATPIPRTLSMSYYADLDVSLIDQLPPGRTPVVTKLVADGRREEIIDRVRRVCRAGRQAYWVCPLIEESETLQLQTALATFETLAATFSELKVGLVHGRLKPADKAAVMEAFQRNEVQLLVATTVIEVGVDVPNATLMVIEHAERMGLAQLHQLRGRVGRGAAESACILLYQSPLSDNAAARLKIIYENHDGFEIARQDLALRGPGEYLGARQSGVPLLRVADLDSDADLLDAARALAETLLDADPARARRHMDRWLGSRDELLRA